jgi:hypothetical protein
MSNSYAHARKLGYAALMGLFMVVTGLWATQTLLSQDASKEFQTGIQNYVALQKKASDAVPPVPKNVTDPSITAKHEQQLAQAIRDLRPKARPGDIFTPAAQKMIAAIVKAKLDANARKVILGDGNPRTGEMPTPVSIAVNATYPSSASVSTMPPSLLMALPTLPPEVEFRFVGHTLILRDVKANMIVDFIPNAI